MFSRFVNASRAAGRTAARTKRNISSAQVGLGSRRMAGLAAATAAGVVGVTVMSARKTETQASVAQCAVQAESKNTAFVFIKPHAVTEATKAMVNKGLQDNGMTILTEGTLTAEQIDEGMLIDNHYYAIASKATILKPHQLNVPAEKFSKQFGLGWQEALDKGVVHNAKDACTLLGLDADGLNKEWAKAKKAGKLVKFGGGFYCGLVDTVEGKDPVYVFNGFFMSMRSDYVAPGAKIHYYVVEWDSKKLSWEDFRGTALGPTDPNDAPTKSLRGMILQNWKALGLTSCPNIGNNGVHASASPFEAMAERMNWLGAKLEEDPFGKELLAAGIPAATIKQWSVDPTVTYGAERMPIKMSLFDSLEDTNSDMCLARAMMINGKSGFDLAQVGGGLTVGAILGALLGKSL